MSTQVKKRVVQVAYHDYVNNTTPSISEVNCAPWQGITWYLSVNTSDTTVDLKIQEADTSGGSFADITGAAITQLSSTATSGDPATISISLTPSARKDYQKPVLVIGNGSTGAEVCLWYVLENYRGQPDAVVEQELTELVEV